MMQFIDLNSRIEKIKNNDDEINVFVEEYKPFIASTVEKITGKFVRYGQDEELSIALIAFVEAIKSFDSSKGSFLGFSKSVMRKRLIDYFRKEKKHSKVISINQTSYYKNEEEEIDYSTGESLNRYSIEQISEYRRLELNELKKQLEFWEISFSDLIEASPKHEKTKKLCQQIVQLIVSRTDILDTLKNKKYLPVAEIEKSLKIPRKKIERMRKYIIAAVVIMLGDYQYIREYIEWK